MLSVGEILKKQREKLGIKLPEVEKQIKIRQKFLDAVEHNNWNVFSTKIYVSGIIKNYSELLGLEPKRTLAFFNRDYERKETIKFKKKVASHYLTSETKKVAITALIIVFVIFFGYFTYQLKQYFSPPTVEILSPKTTNFTNEDRVKIIGKTEKDAAVTIFGERIYQNSDGIFEYEFPLKKGKNELSIEVVGANGRREIIEETYLRKE